MSFTYVSKKLDDSNKSFILTRVSLEAGTYWTSPMPNRINEAIHNTEGLFQTQVLDKISGIHWHLPYIYLGLYMKIHVQNKDKIIHFFKMNTRTKYSVLFSF